MKYIELVKTMGARRGFAVTNNDACFILWEHTGFPGFFEPGRPPLWQLRRQIRVFFRGAAPPLYGDAQGGK